MLTLPRAHTLALALVSSKLLFLATAGADQIDLGTGSYRSDLPPGEDGKPRRSIDAQPLISQNFDGPIPTNDWWSSLLWPMHSPHSMAMFPHPLAVRAHPARRPCVPALCTRPAMRALHPLHARRARTSCAIALRARTEHPAMRARSVCPSRPARP